jgi:putative molybdopterin biosynthesis protein
MPERNVYLRMKTLEEARTILFDAFSHRKMPAETVSVEDAIGRVLAEAVYAKLSSPSFHAAAMDGFAVRAEETFGASEAHPKELIIGESAFAVNTGHVLPEGANAVIMIEHIRQAGAGRIVIEAPAYPWQYVRKMGEDIVATQLIFGQGHRLTPYCVGALISGGVFQVSVRQNPRVLIIPTGSELVESDASVIDRLKPGQVIESNSKVLMGLCRQWGADPVRHDIVRDDPAMLQDAIEDGFSNGFDLVMTVGGSSAGTEDFSRKVMAGLGEVLVHGVTMMPGKPVLIAKAFDRPMFGIPGYPVSAIMAFEQLAGPLICRMLGATELHRHQIDVEPIRKIPSKLGLEEFLRVKIGIIGDRKVAISLPRGAGSITTLTQADAILRIPHGVEGIAEKERVAAELLKPVEELRNTVVVVGSHDNTLDVLADVMMERTGCFTLSSSHVGSMGGITAVRRGVCHAAGIHLLDTEDGSYNRSYLRKYLSDLPLRRIQLVMRDQGLIVAKGNPKNIRSISDLARDDITFINRQAGSGTRILLDFELKRLGISPGDIRGYERDEFTHMAVAVAVLGNTADVGLGIFSAARALHLDFIPVVTEQYDLIIPASFFDTDPIQAMMDAIRSETFRHRAMALGGYHIERTGTILD